MAAIGQPGLAKPEDEVALSLRLMAGHGTCEPMERVWPGVFETPRGPTSSGSPHDMFAILRAINARFERSDQYAEGGLDSFGELVDVEGLGDGVVEALLEEHLAVGGCE